MFTDLFIKFLMWMEKHGDLVGKVITFTLACCIAILIVKIIIVFPSFIKLIWR